MLSRLAIPLTVALTLGATATAARADDAALAIAPAPTPTEARPVRLGLVLGLFTPVGTLGLDLQVDVAPHVSLSGGVGQSFSGPQAAVMPRLHIGDDAFRVYVGEGISGGRFDPPEFCWEACEDESDPLALWANTEIGLDVSGDSIFLRVFGGVGLPIAASVTWDEDQPALPYGGVVLGARL
jgi:hypothetical protein